MYSPQGETMEVPYIHPTDVDWTPTVRHTPSFRSSNLALKDSKLNQLFQYILPFFFSPRLHPRHVEVPRLGVSSELQLPAYTMATATQDLSRVSESTPQLTATLDP